MNLFNNVNSRLSASLIHLALSVAAIGIILLLIITLWFPSNLIFAGAVDGLKVLISVDLVLGPLLTFIVFNKVKKELKRDLIIIVIIQLSALFAGLFIIYNERPALQVLADDGVHLIAHSDLKIFKVEGDYSSKKYSPAAYLLDLPENWADLPNLKLTTEFIQERPFSYRNDLYIPYEEITKDIFIARLQKISDNKTEASFTEKPTKHKSKDCEWLRLISKHNKGYACINYEHGIVDLSEKKIF